MRKHEEVVPARKKRQVLSPAKLSEAKSSCKDCDYDQQDIDSYPCSSCHTRH